MILQALTRHYEDLLARGKIAKPGWGPAKVSLGLQIDDNGQLKALLPLKEEREQGKDKKKVYVPRSMQVPMPVKRTSGVMANFLCDNAGYLLGMDAKGKPERTQECFAACKALHLALLKDVDDPAAQAICAFFRHWDAKAGASLSAVQDNWDELMAGGNLVFWYQGDCAAERPALRQAWQAHYDRQGAGPQLPCLVTGQRGPVALVHPAIKGVRDAQSSGAALISFNAPAFCSYSKEQGANAPMSEYAAFAYTSALNHLLADREHMQVIGDMTVVCWAEGGEQAYQEVAWMGMGFGAPQDGVEQSELRAVLSALAQGRDVDWQDKALHPGTHFYVLALAPNASRLSVRFFLQDTFGRIVQNLHRHYQDLDIARPAYDTRETLTLWQLLAETVNPNARDKAASPQMAGDVLRSILTGARYPATLINGAMLRIRAEHDVTRGRAAILKAYYLRYLHPDCPKEVLTVQLNDDSNYLPYVLGRMFSLLEAIQQAANPGINTTIKDKYFNSAAAMPASIFPLLIGLAQKHLRKLNIQRRVFFDKQLGELTQRVHKTYPTRLSFAEQGAFQLGYYHQTQKRYAKKEDQQDA